MQYIFQLTLDILLCGFDLEIVPFVLPALPVADGEHGDGRVRPGGPLQNESVRLETLSIGQKVGESGLGY